MIGKFSRNSENTVNRGGPPHPVACIDRQPTVMVFTRENAVNSEFSLFLKAKKNKTKVVNSLIDYSGYRLSFFDRRLHARLIKSKNLRNLTLHCFIFRLEKEILDSSGIVIYLKIRLHVRINYASFFLFFFFARTRFREKLFIVEH